MIGPMELWACANVMDRYDYITILPTEFIYCVAFP